MTHFRSSTFCAPSPGPALIVLGAVHGNEVCGKLAIERVMGELGVGVLNLRCGRITFVPVTNPLAYAKGTRNGDRNLNRKLRPTTNPVDFEDHVANWLCPLLAEHDVLLDLHSFHAGDRPFVMVGPENNDCTLEPFAHATDEEALALRLGIDRAVDGWLCAYAEGVTRRRSLAEKFPEVAIDADVTYGIGTTEYMRSIGGWGLTLECGRHDEESAIEVAYRAILNAMAHLRILDASPPEPCASIEGLRLRQVVQRLDKADSFARDWQSFDRVAKGETIAVRASGEILLAPGEGYIVFPNRSAEAGREWFYWADYETRLRLAAHNSS